MNRPRLSLFLIVLAMLSVALASGASPAGAAVITSEPVCCDSHGLSFGQELLVTAAPGERNDIEMSPASLGRETRWRIEDRGEPLALGESTGCTLLDRHTASCAEVDVTVALGDGDDALRMSGHWRRWLKVDGGPGNDLLDVTHPAPGHEVFAQARVDGGPGNDVVTGVMAYDTVVLSAGHDRLTASTPQEGVWATELQGLGADRWDVDLAAGTAVHGDDRSEIAGFDQVTVDHGTLTGTDGSESLTATSSTARSAVDGGGGDDMLRGMGTLRAGAGADDIVVTGPSRVDAGPGDDDVTIYGGGTVDLRCGAGHDAVSPSDHERWAVLRLDAACETTTVLDGPAGAITARPVVARHSVGVRVSCPSRRPACRGRLAVRGLPARVPYAVRSGTARTILVPARGHRPTRERGRIRIRVFLPQLGSVSWWSPPIPAPKSP